MKNFLISEFEKKSLKKQTKHSPFRSGDTVRVHYKIQEGTSDKQKFRIQIYEGVVTRLRKGVTDASFTVRKIGANSIGVERIFPLYTSYIDKIEVVAKGLVRRARLYYLRDRTGKSARIRSKYFGKALSAGEKFVSPEEALARMAQASEPTAEEIMNQEAAALAAVSAENADAVQQPAAAEKEPPKTQAKAPAEKKEKKAPKKEEK